MPTVCRSVHGAATVKVYACGTYLTEVCRNMRFALRSLFVLSLLYGLVFAFGDAYFANGNLSLWWGVAFVVAIIGIQYIIAPWLIEWVLPIGYYDDDLPAVNREFLRRQCQERGLPMPRMGVILTGTPNAFAFGRLQSDARIVVTKGLIDILSEDELNAVLAHELGHIAHYDFAVMALASLAPLLLWQIYAWTNRINGHGRIISYGAYLAYWVGQFLVLLLNRTREYGADAFSAERTGSPVALGSALLKIGYGMVRENSETARLQKEGTKDEKAAAGKQKQLGTAIGIMGIMAATPSQGLVLGMNSPEEAARVLQWDLVSPWSRVYELNSTHPLTALRLRALNKLAALRGEQVQYPLPENTRIRWAGFPLEFLFWALPLLCGFVLISWAWIGRPLAHAGLHVPPYFIPSAMILLGISWAARIAFRYHGRFTRKSVRDLLEILDVNEMRPKAVEVTGEIIGHGIPGAVWSPDLILRDETGIMFVLYRSSIPFGRLFFALRSADRLIGERITVQGWYRRGLKPYVEVAKVEADVSKARSGKGPVTLFGSGSDQTESVEYEHLVERSYSRWIQLVASALATTIGVVWLLA